MDDRMDGHGRGGGGGGGGGGSLLTNQEKSITEEYVSSLLCEQTLISAEGNHSPVYTPVIVIQKCFNCCFIHAHYSSAGWIVASLLFWFPASLHLPPQTVTSSWGTPRSSHSIPSSTAQMASANSPASPAASWCRRAACVTSCMAARPASASPARCRKLWMNVGSSRLRSFCTRRTVKLDGCRIEPCLSLN